MMQRLPMIAFAAAMAAIPFIPGMPPFWIVLLDNIGLSALVAMGLVLLTGVGGLTSFGQAAFCGFGAYTTAVLTTAYGVSPWLTLPLSLVVSGAAAVLLGLVTVRLSGHYLPLGTLAWGLGLFYLFSKLEFLGRNDPNPSAITTGADQSIWIVTPGSSENAAPRKIAAGHSAAISPKGDRIAFLRNSQIWLAELSGSDRSTLLYQPRSGVTSSQPEWSPDGSKIAFVSDRGNHSFIAVYDFAAKSLTYMEPTVDRDGDPVWSPHGKRVSNPMLV